MYFVQVRDQLSRTRRFGMFMDESGAKSWAEDNTNNEVGGGPWVTWQVYRIEMASSIEGEAADELGGIPY